MNRFLILLFVLNTNSLFAQQRFQLIDSKTNITPYYSKTPKQFIDTIRLMVKLTGGYDAEDPKNNTLHLQLKTLSLPNRPKLVDDAIALPQEKWAKQTDSTTSDTTIEITVRLITENLTDTIKYDEFGQLIIKDQPDNFHTVRLTNALLPIDTKYKPNKPFWVEVGSNFDLIDGPEPNNFFAGVFFHKRDMRPFTFRKEGGNRTTNLGAFGGVFESKSITSITEQSFSLREYYDTSSFLTNVKDSLKVFKGIGSVINRRTVRNVGLFFSPQVRLTRGSANEDGFHVFGSFWMELQWQKVVEESEFNQFRKMDSSNLHLDTVLNNSRYNSRTAKREIDFRSHYFGFGLPIFFRETIEGNTVQLFVNPVIGISNQPTQEYLTQGNEVIFKQSGNLNRKWLPFYAIQFRLNEENYGISFTGEVRGLLQRNNPPIVSIALSKKFDLTKFIEFGK